MKFFYCAAIVFLAMIPPSLTILAAVYAAVHDVSMWWLFLIIAPFVCANASLKSGGRE